MSLAFVSSIPKQKKPIKLGQDKKQETSQHNTTSLPKSQHSKPSEAQSNSKARKFINLRSE